MIHDTPLYHEFMKLKPIQTYVMALQFNKH